MALAKYSNHSLYFYQKVVILKSDCDVKDFIPVSLKYNLVVLTFR